MANDRSAAQRARRVSAITVAIGVVTEPELYPWPIVATRARGCDPASAINVATVVVTTPYR